MNTKKRFKFLRTGLRSEYGGCRWKIGEWKKFDGELELCKAGFHCSKGLYQAFSYIQGEILAEVEVRGSHLSGENDDKEVWSEMRVVRAWKWKKQDSVAFAIFAARQVLSYFEEQYPNDSRPRQAIEAAEQYLAHPCKKHEAAAWTAEAAAWTAGAAAWTTGATARATARAAAWTAGDAARATARDAARATARAAAWTAGDAARATAGATAKRRLFRKFDKWMQDHISELEEIR